MKHWKLALLWAAVITGLYFAGVSSVYAFNLITDIEQQTTWSLGSSVQAGTAVALKSDASTSVKAGQFLGSAMADVADYRFLNLSAGGIFVPQSDGTLRALDSAKMGLNFSYLFRNFANQPPALLKNLVVGPTISTTLVTTPHVFIPSVEVNYQFGK